MNISSKRLRKIIVEEVKRYLVENTISLPGEGVSDRREAIECQCGRRYKYQTALSMEIIDSTVSEEDWNDFASLMGPKLWDSEDAERLLKKVTWGIPNEGKGPLTARDIEAIVDRENIPECGPEEKDEEGKKKKKWSDPHDYGATGAWRKKV